MPSSGTRLWGSIGEKATYRGLKAAVTAGDYMAQDANASKDHVLAVRVYQQKGAVRRILPAEDPSAADMDEDRIVMHLEAHWRRGPPSVPLRTQDLVVSAKTQARKAAAAVAGAIRTKGGAANVRCMGAAAIYQALTSVALAQRYLDTDPGDGLELLVVPRFEVLEEPNLQGRSPKDPPPGKPKRQLVLHVDRVPE